MSDSGPSDAELARQIFEGQKPAEEVLTKRYERGVLQILVRQTGSYVLAQELCQETLIIALKRLRTGPLENPEKLAAFIAQTARNLAIADRRKQRRRRTDSDEEALAEMADDERNQERDAHRESASVAIHSVLAEMKSARDRHLLVRYYLQEEDREVICRDLGVALATFNVVLFRARSRFLELLQKRGLSGGDLLTFMVL
jgi:RNA polymerase sigma-70 factor (ECF subfamily)